MSYIVELVEEDRGEHRPLSLTARAGAAWKALQKARQMAHDHGYMPSATTEWERTSPTRALSSLLCR